MPAKPQLKRPRPGATEPLKHEVPVGARVPMSVDRATVHRIAHLARIAVTEDEAARLEKELSGILEWVAQLDEIDTSNVEPMTRVVAMTMKKRKDEVTDGNCADDILKNAPAVDDHYFVVPKIVE